jgi:hypothetical protein
MAACLSHHRRRCAEAEKGEAMQSPLSKATTIAAPSLAQCSRSCNDQMLLLIVARSRPQNEDAKAAVSVVLAPGV